MNVSIGSWGQAHDATHGTDWYWTFRNWYEYAKRHYISPVTDRPPEWITLYYDPEIKYNLQTLVARPWLLTCWFLIPHDSRMARLIYEGAKGRFLIESENGAAYFASFAGSTQEDSYATAMGISLAKELGDVSVYAKLRKWIESNYQPVFDTTRGEFYYQFRFQEPFPRGQYNDWIMPSFVGGEKTWWNMFNKPNLSKFMQPTVHQIDYPRMGVTQAFYDAGERALVVTTYPIEAGAAGEETMFRVKNLEAAAGYTVYMDGKPYNRWKILDGEMEITTTLDPHSFTVAKQ